MELEQIGISALRQGIRNILKEVHQQQKRYLIVRFGRPTAVLLSVEEYAQLTGQQK